MCNYMFTFAERDAGRMSRDMHMTFRQGVSAGPLNTERLMAAAGECAWRGRSARVVSVIHRCLVEEQKSDISIYAPAYAPQTKQD